MRIVICGGGGLGHTCSAMLSTREGVSVDLLTNRPEKWNHSFTVNTPDKGAITGKLNTITANPADVIPDADWVILCLPAFLVEKTLLRIKKHLSEKTIVGCIVANTGFFFFAHKHLPSRTKLFGLQRVPYISRVVEYGKEANLLGYRDKLIAATENIADRETFRRTIEFFFEETTVLANSFYEVTLSNSNPILHTGRLYTMWKDWDGSPFDRCSLFYKEWTMEASELEIEMDKEFFALLAHLNISTEHIETLLEHYESTDAHGMTEKIRSIASLSTILSPMKQTAGGWVPDLESRYFTEDFPFGLRFIVETAQANGLDTPHLKKVYDWGTAHYDRYRL